MIMVNAPASEKKRQANRRNGALSRGPKTAEGKAVSSRNALKTGLLSRELILPGENPAEFHALFDELCHDHQPVGILEMTLLERVAIAMWRQRRLVRAEQARIRLYQKSRPGINAPKSAASSVSICFEDILARLHDSDTQVKPKWNSEAEIRLRLKQEPLVGQIDVLEKELRLLHLAATMTFGVFGVRFPLMARELPAPDTVLPEADTLRVMEVYPDLDEVSGLWLRCIVEHRQSLLAEADADHEACISSSSEILSRYQAALDNEWYKGMRAFREAQSYRMKTLTVSLCPPT